MIDQETFDHFRRDVKDLIKNLELLDIDLEYQDIDEAYWWVGVIKEQTDNLASNIESVKKMEDRRAKKGNKNVSDDH